MATKHFNLIQSGANCTLTYNSLFSIGLLYSAQVRVSKISYGYGVTFTESHARDNRGFYPHRRTNGEFTILIDCIHYKEFQTLQSWLKNFNDVLLNNSDQVSVATEMSVSLPARNFHKLGVPVSGMGDHDHIGSNVFSVPLTFVTTKTFGDKVTDLLSTDQISQFDTSQTLDRDASDNFYPITSVSKVDSATWDDLGIRDPIEVQIEKALNKGKGPNQEKIGF